MHTDLAPIVLFVYNRPSHTRQTLQAPQRNELADQSVLCVHADGAKDNPSEGDLNIIKEVHAIVQSEACCKEVILIQRDRNWGLADNIVDGVTSVVNKHFKITVLEDDIVT